MGEEAIRWFLLICRYCDPPLTMPFVSAQARGRWAAEHRVGTGHDAWDVWEAEVPLRVVPPNNSFEADLGQPEPSQEPAECEATAVQCEATAGSERCPEVAVYTVRVADSPDDRDVCEGCLLTWVRNAAEVGQPVLVRRYQPQPEPF